MSLPPYGAATYPVGRGLASPLRWSTFRALWIASLASYIGTWMHEVGAAWLMTSLTSSPALIALVPAVAALPFVLLALPAGALADVVDRRRLLLGTQGLMLITSAALGIATFAGVVSAPVLLAVTCALGAGAALNGPAWQAIVPELVERGEVPAALALNGLGINAARAAGPALGGFIVGWLGPGAAFLCNAVSFAGVIAVLHGWRRETRPAPLPAESIVGAIRSGVRYARHAAGLRAVLARALAFTFFASALWALLPALVRHRLGAGPQDYGLLLAAIGGGAVAGAAVYPALRRRLGAAGQVAAASVLLAALLPLVGVTREPAPLAALMVCAGVAWLIALTALHAAAQSALAPWVRGRGLSVHLLVIFGGLSAGSAFWGLVAQGLGLEIAFAAAGAGMLAALAATARLRLSDGAAPEPAAAHRYTGGEVAGADPDVDRGPILVTVEYRVDPAAVDEFMEAMRDVRRLRLRDGAYRWDLLVDPAVQGRHLETFMVDSWLEHLRQHERFTERDHAVEERARRCHSGPLPPIVSHFIARDLPH
jgi:predicted MFS family arabinose efflux permease